MILDRKQAPPIHDAVEFDYTLPPITRERLSNGLPLYWLNAGVQDVVELDFVFPAGLWHEAKPAVAQAVAALLKNGTSKRSAHALDEAIEFYGASLKVQAGNDYATVTLHTLTKHLPQLLPVVYEIITDAVFPEEELAIYRKNAIQRLLISLRQCEFVANQRIDALLFGPTHPYGRFTQKEKIEALQREDLLSFYKEHYALSRMQLFMAGNVGEKEVRCLEEVFGTVPRNTGASADRSYSPEPAARQPERLVNDPDGVQGAIRIGRLFPGRHHPDFAPMVVLNTLFGGYFGSRLMSNIREDKGYTYGIYSSLSTYMHGGSIIVHTEVGRDVVEDAVKEIYHEMERICSEPVPEDELLLVKNYLLGNLLGDLDGPFSILRRWRTIILNGFTEAHFNENVAVYKTIGAQELQTLAQRYFAPADYHEVVVI
jgi:zinc protease